MPCLFSPQPSPSNTYTTPRHHSIFLRTSFALPSGTFGNPPLVGIAAATRLTRLASVDRPTPFGFSLGLDFGDDDARLLWTIKPPVRR